MHKQEENKDIKLYAVKSGSFLYEESNITDLKGLPNPQQWNSTDQESRTRLDTIDDGKVFQNVTIPKLLDPGFGIYGKVPELDSTRDVSEFNELIIYFRIHDFKHIT